MASFAVTLVAYQCLIVALLLAALVGSSRGQNYHFSNGWYAGKKRSSPSSSSTAPSSSAAAARVGVAGLQASADGLRSLDGSCGMRTETLALIERIVQEEALRMQKLCVSSASVAWQEYLENAARKLAGESKW